MLDKTLLRQRISFIRQGSEVERWHTKRMQQRNDVGHHSFHVAWFAYLMATSVGLTNFSQQRVVMAALAHDLAEQTTGDVPGDFKRELQLREQFGQYEQAIFREIALDFWSELSEAEARVVKLADMFEGAFFIVSEASFGNRRVGEVFRNYREYIDGYAPFSECEAGIIEYLDDLWRNYGADDIAGWGRTAHREASRRRQEIMGDESLSGVIATEEEEGRALPLRGPVSDKVFQEAEDHMLGRPQSEPPIQGDTGIPEQPQNDAMDDRATSDLGPEPPSSPANARQHGGDHYKGVGYEHWDLVLDTRMNYFQGCATKYVTRWRKHEAGELNLLKAIHYIDKLEEARDAERIKPWGTYTVSDIVSFCTANALTTLEEQVIKDIVGWRLSEARRGLERLRAGYTEPEMHGGKSYYGQVDQEEG